MLNKLHADGSIKLEDKINVVVSPYSDNFYDEIEDGVKKSVGALLELGYLTVSSCDGFHTFNETAHITVVVDSDTTAQGLINNLNQLGIDSTIDNTFGHFGLDNVNNMFMRQYVEYKCVKIFMYDHKPIFSPFKKFIISRNTAQLKKLERYLK